MTPSMALRGWRPRMTDSGLSPRQIIFATGLAQGLSQAAAGAEVGISSRTARRWVTDPEVKAAVAALVDGMVAAASRRLASGLADAVVALQGLLADDSLPPSVRLRVIEAWLSHAARAYEINNLAERVKALEGAQSESPS